MRAARLAQFRGEQDLLEVELQPQALAPPGRAVELAGILAGEMHRDDVAAILDGLGHERLLPLQVGNLAPGLKPRAEAGGEIEDLFVRGVSVGQLPGGVAPLATELIDGDEHAAQRLHIHQHIVHRETYPLVAVALAQDTDQRDAVQATQRVIRGEDEPSVGGDILRTVHLDSDLQVLQCRRGELGSPLRERAP